VRRPLRRALFNALHQQKMLSYLPSIFLKMKWL
jgi:hypothetical protein